MIIGIDISQIVYQTGVSRYTKELVKNLLKFDKKNTYKLFAGVFRQRKPIDDFLSSLKSSNFKPYIKLFPPTLADRVWNRWHLFPIEKFIGKVDIFHTSNWAQPPSKSLKVTTVHDLTPLIHSKHHLPAIVSNFKNNLYWIEKECNKIIVDSQSTKNDLQKYIKYPSENIEVIYLAADKKFTQIKDQERISKIKHKYNITKDFILSVATHEPRKNLKMLISAFSKIKSNAQLVLVGKYGWGENQLPDQENIITTGFVSDDDLPILYSAAKVFVYPSLYEGFGLPVLEAISCGCPVITSNISSLPEVAGSAAILINPKKESDIVTALETILTSPSLYQKMSNDSLKQSKKFSWLSTAQSTLSVYENLSNKII
jgi:glycosyltransferase involved in cell wall biosynthesis